MKIKHLKVTKVFLSNGSIGFLVNFKWFIFSFIFCVNVIYAQDSKKITEKFFPDFDLDVPTPAFNKKEASPSTKN